MSLSIDIDLKQMFGPALDRYNPSTLKALRRFGNKRIDRLVVIRVPIRRLLSRLLSLLSFGGSNRLLRRLKYDNFFHLGMICYLEDGQRVLVEKNEVVTVRLVGGGTAQVMPVDWNVAAPDLTINKMLSRTIKQVGARRFFHYRGFNNSANAGNCQRFISDVLESNGLMTP